MARQAADNFLHIGKREVAVGRGRQDAAPGVEYLNSLSTCRDLCVEVIDNRIGEFIEQQVHRLGMVIEEFFRMPEIFAAAAFDHIGSQCPWASRKPNERNRTIQFAPYKRNGVSNIGQLACD